MGDSMTDFIAGVEAADERRDIDADFVRSEPIVDWPVSSLTTFMTIRLGRSLRSPNISGNW